MRDFWEIFRFELRFRFRQVSTYIFFAVMFALALLFISTDIVQIGGGSGRVQGNAPYVITIAGTILIAFGAVIASATMGTAVYRDFEANAHELFFATPISKAGYLLGRFVGAYVVTAFIFSGIPLGFLLGTVAPWVPDKASFGPFNAGAYLSFIGIFLLPNLLFIGALFFIFGALTRSLLAIYAQGVILLIGWSIAQSLLGNLDNRVLAAYFDPFGLSAVSQAVRYWTVSERNTQLLPLSQHILGNRLLWMGIAGVIFAVGYRLFTFSRNPLTLPRRKGAKTAATGSLEPARLLPKPTASLAPTSSMGGVGDFLRLAGFYLREIITGVPFLVITLAGMLLLIVAAVNADKIFDTTVYPVTRVMSETIAGGFTIFFLILITFYAGELTWRERVLRLDQIADSQPIATGIVMGAKVMALLAMLVLLNLVLVVTGIAVQAFKGYFNFEIGLYFAYLFGTVFPGLVCLTFLAFFLHAVLNNKFFGHTALILSFIISATLPTLGLERNLYLFGGGPTVVYSDMNGFGPFVTPLFWWSAYWFAFSIILVIIANRIWVRGTETRLLARWQRTNFGIGSRIALGIAGIAFLGIGAFTFYNTDVLNRYETSKQGTKLQAKYERDYKATWEKKPMPRITAVKMDVSLYPERRQYELKGTYTLRNKGKVPVPEVALQLDRDLTIKSLNFGIPAKPGIADTVTGFRTYTLERPLAPGEETTLDFHLAYEKRGFPNRGVATNIVENGTFLTQPGPSIGYQPGGEISDETERRKQKLPKRLRRAPATDKAALANTYIGNDADWITFEATVRTAPDQIALAPGYLQREWNENGRRCFHYKMDAPIRNFYSFLSARYAVKRDKWIDKGGKPVALEIYYHPTHTYNLDRMMAGMKAALTYCSNNFSPYQFRQMRILEFPAYAQFAQSFPNTVPYSESIGFIAKVDEAKEDIDYPYYVTAHEVAHQWWAHQVLGANVEGAEMLSESLAEYTAIKIMEQKDGLARTRKFLRFDLDRYLRGRGSEREGESPLVKVQNQQYIHYPKGALAFYALSERIGTEKLNATLSRFVQDKQFQEPPYATAPELMAYLHEDAPADAQEFLTDQFEKITLYDCRTISATKKKLPTGKWEVTMKVSAAKKYSDPGGKESEAPMNDTVDIGVFAQEVKKSDDKNALGKPLAWEKKKIGKGEQTLTFVVDDEPFKAGIDPYNKLIDRTPTDNVMSVK